MKNLILIIIVISFGCVKTSDVLVVTNTEEHEVTFKLDFEKSLHILQPGEDVIRNVSGWHHVEVGSYSDSIYVDGYTTYP